MKIFCLIIVVGIWLGGDFVGRANETTVTAEITARLQRLQTARAAANQAYWQTLRQNSERQAEHQARALKFGDKVMKFHWVKKNGTPDDAVENDDALTTAEKLPLFIALHGGGSAPSAVNDAQYKQMKSYYLANVHRGVYVATRGVTDTYNLHSVDESYPLYDRLIENMIAFANVDPERVYVLGFSAGGDGTYQIAARMPDRFAAANMSAGHHNGVSGVNLYNLPFLLQVGENDTAYNRHHETVNFYAQLLNNREKFGGAEQSYPAACYVHLRRGHNFVDNSPTETPQTVYQNPCGWLDGNDTTSEKCNTAAITWLTQFKRNPYPARVVWDLTTCAPKRGAAADYFYYLKKTPNTRGERVIVRLDKIANALVVEELTGEIEILLNETMFDFTRPFTVITPSSSSTTTRTEYDLNAINRLLAAAEKSATTTAGAPATLPFILTLKVYANHELSR